MADATLPNWAIIEADYRAGIKALRQIADEHGITEGAIRKRAKREGWERDLTSRIRQKAKSIVRKDAVRKDEYANRQRVPEQVVIDANAELEASIQLIHRQDLKDARDLVKRMFSELAASSMTIEQIHMLADAHLFLQAGPDGSIDMKKRARLIEAWLKSAGLGERAATGQKLVASLSTLIDRERQNYGLDDDNRGKQPDVASLEERLKKYREEAQIENASNVVPIKDRKTA